MQSFPTLSVASYPLVHSVVMLSVVMLSVVMLSVVMLSVVVPFSLHLNEKGVGGIYSAGEGM
jgi:hypothetical protein